MLVFLKHPAPLPSTPAYQPSNINWKFVPPKPELKISKVANKHQQGMFLKIVHEFPWFWPVTLECFCFSCEKEYNTCECYLYPNWRGDFPHTYCLENRKLNNKTVGLEWDFDTVWLSHWGECFWGLVTLKNCLYWPFYKWLQIKDSSVFESLKVYDSDWLIMILCWTLSICLRYIWYAWYLRNWFFSCLQVVCCYLLPLTFIIALILY